MLTTSGIVAWDSEKEGWDSHRIVGDGVTGRSSGIRSELGSSPNSITELDERL